ncbi:unnamed protein product [Rotaria sordida]|uniref:Uncharacterized protein n=2 Tax=Rotaria sordida TaxID=392033 RepID=A0A815SQM9_9BILA|nr:unnamed protein product [Rotaria sordida]CAF1494799.1 unnamed protein product [Rotaria sordida]
MIKERNKQIKDQYRKYSVIGKKKANVKCIIAKKSQHGTVRPSDQEDIQINKVKSLEELFINELRPDLELSEFFGRGIQYLLEINEKNFIPWLSIATIGAIAAVQMAVGGVLIGTGFGLTLGMGLITEGAIDLFTAYGAYRKRQFSWLDYAMHKAVGLAITAASLGISAIKSMGQGTKAIVTAIGEQAIEQITTQTISNDRLTTHIVLHIGKNLKRQAIGQMMFWASGRLLGESLMALNRSSDIGFSFVPDQLKSQISESIQHKVNNVLRDRDLDILLEKMYGIDKINKNQQLKEEIKKITFEVINSQRSFWRKQWDSIGGPLCKGILSSAEKIPSAANMGLIIAGILNTTHEITFILETTREQLLKKLSGFDQENLSMQQILYRYCRFSKDDAKKIANLLEKQGIIELNSELINEQFLTKLNQIDFSEFDRQKDYILNFLTLLHKNMFNSETNNFSKLMQLVSDRLTDQILRIVESQLTSSRSGYFGDRSTKALSEIHQVVVDEKNNSESQNREKQEEVRENNISIAKQNQYNVKDYILEYSQCESKSNQ